MRIILLLLCPLNLFASEIDHEKAPLLMAVGEQRILPLGKFVRYSVSGNSLHYTRLSPGDRLLLKALKPGLGTLILNRSTGENDIRTIRVEQKKSLGLPMGLYQSLNHLNDSEVIEEGDHFILRGTVRNREEASQIAYLRDHYAKYIVNETTLDKDWAAQCLEQLAHFLKEHPRLKMTEAEGDLWVHGSVAHQGGVIAIERSLKSIQPLIQTDIQSLKDHDPTIYFKVFLLEVKKDQLTELGMGWPGSQSGGLQISPFQLGFDNKVELTLHAMSQKGAVNILSSPELVVRAPGQAEIFAGGELPIREHSKFSESVIWKNVGLLLKLDVQSMAGEQVRLNVETELSHLDSNLSNDNIPGVQSNHIKTQVDAPLGKPLLLSGLLQEDVRQQVQELPGLSQIPILGKLFSSDSFKKNKSELVAVLLPYSSPPPHPMQRISSEIPKGFLPIPRIMLSPDELEEKKLEKNYPWNIL